MIQKCSNCDYELAPGDRFCAECGEPVVSTAPHAGASDITGTVHGLGLATSDTGPQQAVELPDIGLVEVGQHLLVIVRGPGAGTRIDLSGDVMVAGRAPEAPIFLDDITVSRHHARFESDGDEWNLIDLGSLNGTYVDRQRVDSVRLDPGDEIQIGKYRFQYVTGVAAEETV